MKARQFASRRPLFFALALTTLGLVTPLAAQTDPTDPALEAGLKPFGTYQASDIDFISTKTGKLHLHIPLLSYPQRGTRLRANYFVTYDSFAYTVVCDIHQHCHYQLLLNLPWSAIGARIWTDAAPSIRRDNPYSQYPYQGTLVSVFDPDATGHLMGALPAQGPTTQMRALDASGYYANTTNWLQPTIYDADGNSYNMSTGIVQDAIGNQMLVPFNNSGGITYDTIGRSISPPPTTGPACPSWTTWQVPGQTGGVDGPVNYQLCFESGPYNRQLLDKLQLPNQTQYTFTYQITTDSRGSIVDLIKIGLPTGGSISYTWTTESPYGCGYSSNYWRRVSSRTVDDGNGHQWTWYYNRRWNGTGYTFAITDPLNNVATHITTALNGKPCSLYETQYVQQDNAQHVLRTVNTAYAWTADPGRIYSTPNDVLAVVPTSTQTILEDGTQSSKTIAYPPNTFTFCDLGQQPGSQFYSCQPSQGSAGTAIYVGNAATACANDYGGGTGCTANTIQQTVNTYLAFQNGNYLNSNELNLKSQVRISSPLLGNGSTTNYTYDGGAGAGPGLLTRIDKGLGAVYTKTYTAYGMPYQDIDPLSNTTTYAYDGTNLFLSAVTNALRQVTQYSYDANTGLLTSVTDPNQEHTSYTYDQLNRPLSVQYPDNGSTQYSYNDTPPANVTVTTWINQSQNIQRTGWVDGLGRVIQTALDTDPEGPDYVKTTYDGLGRRASVTNPYRTTSDPTYGVTQYQYDALNRLTTQAQPDNGTITYSYAGNTTTIADEAGTQRKTQANALGWLTNIWEAPNAIGYNYPTSYGYDGLGNLTSVIQSGSRNRAFVYDSLSRLTQSTNPEAGAMTYGYDTSSSLTSKRDARGITINYTPDALHRVISKTYSDSEPAIHYCYDNVQTACGVATVSNGIGRRTGMADTSGTKAWWYDPVGRVAKTSQTINGYGTGNISYSYNLDGSLAQVTYPTQDEAQYTYSGAGRVTQASWIGILEGWQLATNTTYNAPGLLTGYTSGDGSTVTRTYNARLQPVDIKAAWSRGTLFWLTYNFNFGRGDNGNVIGITDQVHSQNSQGFTYDAVNRLYTASFYGGSDRYGYDAWGNLLSKTITSGTGESWSATVDTNNRLSMSGYGYDQAGNLTSALGVPGVSAFNAENQWVTQSGYHASFLYDGDGKRVRTSDAGISPTTTYYFNDESGNVLLEWDANLQVDNLYFYLGGERIAYGPSLGDYGLYFYYADHLGSVRAITNQQAQSKCFSSDYYPWGGVISATYSNSCPPQYSRFTGKDRDPVMGHDYFGARYYKSDMSRFYSPDWSASVEPVPYAKLGNPQSLNLYTYVLGNPVSSRDRDGHANDGGGFFGVTAFLGLRDDGSDAQKLPPPADDKLYTIHKTVYAKGPSQSIECFAQLKYRAVTANDSRLRFLQTMTSGTAATHSLWYVQDSSGSQYILSGGPQSGYLNAFKTPVANAPPTDLTAGVVFDSGISSSYCPYVDAMVGATENWSNNTISYSPTAGPNSNSFAHFVGSTGGFGGVMIPAPPGSLGWNAAIPFP